MLRSALNRVYLSSSTSGSTDIRLDVSHEEQAGVEPAHPLFRDSPVFETGALPFGHCSSAGIPLSFTPVRGDFHLWMCARRSHSDSNRGNRSHGSTVFKTAAFSRSAMTPLNAHLIRLRLRIICACQCAVNGESLDFPIFSPFGSVRLPGFEPGSRADYRDEDLNLARLPVPPQAR